MPSLPSSSPEKCTAMATSEFSTGKTIFVLAIVVGCFAILWPKVFYPMVQTSFTMTKPHLETDRKEIPKSSSSVCCDVVVDYDINNKFFAKLCGLIVNPHELTTTRPLGEEKLPPGMAQVCREKVLELCSIDVIELLQKDPKDPAYQKVLQEIHFQNVTHCLQYHYAKHEKYLDLANKRKQQDAIRKPIRQDRPTHLHPALIHPAMRERGVPIASRAGEHFTQKPKPGPMTVARPSPGSHGKLPPPVPKGAGSIGFVMPMYTVGIVIFFIYTVMKCWKKICSSVVLFKRTEDKTPKVMDFHMDPEYRKYMLSEEYADSHLETYREFIHKEKPLLGKPLLDEEERKLEEVTEPGFQEMFTAIEGIIAEMDEYRERLKTGQQQSENSGLPSEQIPSTIELPEVVHEAAEDTAMAVIGNFSKSSSPDIDTYEVIGGCKPDADPPSAEISLSSPTTQANEFVYINKEETQTIGLSPVESEGANGFEYIRPGECPVVNGEFSNFEGNTINKDSLITPVRDSSFENILLSESESDALKQFQTAAVLSSSDAQSKLDESVDYEQRFELPEEISLCPTTEPKLITPQDSNDIPKQTERTKDEYQEANLNSLMDKSQSGEQGLELSDDVGDHSTIETKLIISEANIDINKQIEKVMEEDIEAKFISLTDTLKAVETVDYGQTVEVDEELLDYSAIEPVIKSADSNNIQKEAERIDDEHLEANVISLTDTSSLVMTTPEDDSKLSSFVEVESYDGENSVDSDVIETLTVDAVRVSGAESQLIESSEKSELEKPEITTTKEDSKLNSFVEVELFQKESIGDATEMPETDRGFTTTITVLESSEPSFVVSDEKASSNESDIHQKESNTSSFVELEPCEESISEDAAKIHYTSMTTGSVLEGTQSEFLEDGEQKTIQEFTITEGDNLSLFEECELNKEKSNSSGNATEVLITDTGYALLASEEAQPVESIQTIALEEAKEMAEAAAKEETESQTGTISQETDFKKEASETISSAVSAIGESQELVSAEESKNITATDLREEIVTPPPQTIIIQNGNLNDNIEVDASSSSKTSIRSSASSTTQSEEEEEEDEEEEEEEEEESESEEEDRARVSLVHQMKEKPEENKPGSPVSPEHDRLSGCQIWSYWS